MRLAVTPGGPIGSRQTNADPDSDVRAAAAQPRRGPHGKRSRQVARSLLSLKIVPVVLLTLVSSMSACVVPVAPTFQDPPGGLPNIAPYILSASPDFGTFSAVLNPDDFTVSVTVTDQNVGDDLHYRWVIDYPPFVVNNTRPQMAQTIPHSANGIQLQVTETLTHICTLNLAPTVAVHQLAFFLADRPFDDTNPKVLDAAEGPDGLVARANWTFQITCP